MADPLPKFDAPPVLETVIGVQFVPLPNFTGAMAGWFWKSYLSKFGGEWTKTNDVIPLQDQFEQFGPGTGWIPPGIHLATTEATRTQLVRSDEERMVQIQFSRFILNWKRGKNQYPSYDNLLSEFLELFEQFCLFARDAGYGPLGLNQWEMTYVNYLERGELWNNFDDLRKIFKDILIPKSVFPVEFADSINANWRYLLSDNAGRLHVTLNHIKTAPENKEVLRLQFVARGPLTQPDMKSLSNSLNLGHEAIVRTFAAITTSDAQKFWKRTQ